LQRAATRVAFAPVSRSTTPKERQFLRSGRAVQRPADRFAGVAPPKPRPTESSKTRGAGAGIWHSRAQGASGIGDAADQYATVNPL